MSAKRFLKKYGGLQVLKTKKIEVQIDLLSEKEYTCSLHKSPFKFVSNVKGNKPKAVKRSSFKRDAIKSKKVIKRPLVKDYILFSFSNIACNFDVEPSEEVNLDGRSNLVENVIQNTQEDSTTHLWSFRASLADLSCICSSHRKKLTILIISLVC